MTPFEHLSVLISIILGLGIAQLLASVHALAEARARVRVYWLAVVWAVLIFVAQVQWWWSSFGFQDLPLETWSFFWFLFVLLSPVSLYLAAAFALPRVEPGEPCDLRAHYYASRGWFFCMAGLGPALDGMRRMAMGGGLADPEIATNAVGAVLLGSLAISEREAYHVAVSLAVIGVYLYFIVAAALNLG